MRQLDSLPGVLERVRVGHGCTTRRLVIPCGHPGCKNDVRFTANQTLLPPQIIEKKLKRKGWSANARKGTYLCPEHK
tara:strand:- start:209 stop:439 length:231 start_codon:yes stop_codon:yes gene_type:complete